MAKTLVVFLAVIVCAVQCIPLDYNLEYFNSGESRHVITKRFVNPSLASGHFTSSILDKIRTKRSAEDECEKLQLCKLHARSSSNFLAAFELYFVNKENARLWDHQVHSIEDCENRFSCYR